MGVSPPPLVNHLKAGLRPCYLVFGDEPLLEKEQAIDRAFSSLNQGKC
ncbi:DNA polymerase III subunit delta [Aeromonas sobria]